MQLQDSNIGSSHLKVMASCFQIPFEEKFIKDPTEWGKMSHGGANPLHVFKLLKQTLPYVNNRQVRNECRGIMLEPHYITF